MKIFEEGIGAAVSPAGGQGLSDPDRPGRANVK